MTPLLLLSLASAAPPDRVPWSVSAGTVLVEQFGVSPDGLWVSAVSDHAVLLDTGAWEVHTPGCGTAAAVDDGVFYAACAGVVYDYTLVNGALTRRDTLWDAGGDVRGMWVWDGALYVMTAGTGSVDELHRIQSGTVDGSGWPLTVRQGLVEGRMEQGRLFLWHGADDVTTLAVASGGNVPSTAISASGFRDLAVSFALTPYLVSEDTGTILELASSASFIVAAAGLSSPTALALSRDVEDPWAVLATANGVQVRDASAGIGLVQDTLGVSGEVGDAFVTDGYALLGRTDGSLVVATAAPWVDASADPVNATEGDEVTVSFSIDEDAAWALMLDTELLDAGTATAGETLTRTVTVDDRFAEGATGLWVLATDSDGNVGRDRADVIVDSPPPAPTVDVGFADQALVVTVGGVDDLDLDHFVIYVSTEAFEASDYPTGGPADFDATDALVLPVEVAAEPGESVELTLSPLTNGVSYTIGARAVDAGGLEGPMSATQTGTPQETFSAAELAGETGGVSCASASGPGWLFLGGLLGLVGRRRAFAASALLASTTASAGNPLCAGGGDSDSGDATPTCADFEVRYGSRTIEDPDIQAVYGNNAHGILMVEAGPQFFRMVEIDLGFGLYRKFDRANSSSGLDSEVNTMLTLWPLALDGTFRLQLLDEQLVVPFVRAGFDYVMFGERWDDGAGGRNVVKGAKFGNHFGGGVNILLDPFAPGRASLLEAQTGINDTFLTIEWRKTSAASDAGFDLSGTNISVGIKLDY